VIVSKASEQLELRKHFDRTVKKVGRNLEIVERSEATGYVILNRSVKQVVWIIYARHRPKSIPASGAGAPRGSLRSNPIGADLVIPG
jgi:hypothetical protein